MEAKNGGGCEMMLLVFGRVTYCLGFFNDIPLDLKIHGKMEALSPQNMGVITYNP